MPTVMMTTKEQQQQQQKQKQKEDRKKQQHGGGGGGGGGPAPFLVKTHQMVEDRGTDEVISWTEDGAAFVVWKPAELAGDILPNHFKHNNFSSFVRQLNTYGFRKVAPERWEFANDHFRRGEQSLLSEIHRRKAPSSSSAHPHTTPTGKSPDEDQSSTSTTSSNPPQADDNHHHQQQQQRLLLTKENERLKKDNEALASELAQARKQYHTLLGYLSMYADVTKLVGNDSNSNSFAVKNEVAAGCDDGGGVRLFGVCLRKRGRGCDEVGGGAGRPAKLMGLTAPWMEISAPHVQGTN